MKGERNKWVEGLEGVLLRAWAFGEQMRFPSWSDLNLMGRWWGTGLGMAMVRLCFFCWK